MMSSDLLAGGKRHSVGAEAMLLVEGQTSQDTRAEEAEEGTFSLFDLVQEHE